MHQADDALVGTLQLVGQFRVPPSPLANVLRRHWRNIGCLSVSQGLPLANEGRGNRVLQDTACRVHVRRMVN
jgi:hypothetical protein